MKPATGNPLLLGFKEITGESLGLRAEDEAELLPLSSILARLEELHSQEVSLLEIAAERTERLEQSFAEIEDGLLKFWERLKQMVDVPESHSNLFQCIPLEPTIFKAGFSSEAYRKFVTAYGEHDRLNERRGKGLFEFMLAHYMQENRQFKSFNRGLRSKILSHASRMESLYSIWESNQFGRIWTFPGSDISRTAYASATYRLVDALFSLDFKPTYDFFTKYLNPLRKFLVQFLYSLITDDPKTLLQEFAQAAPTEALPQYEVQRTGGQDHEPVFRCTLSFHSHKFEGIDRGKAAAEKKAARAAADLLIATDRRKLPRLIASTISGGMQRKKGGATSIEVPAEKLSSIRRAVGISCSDVVISKCLTLRADIIHYGLSDAATNEEFAFCGSGLVQVIVQGQLGRVRGRFSLRDGILACIKETRHNILRRTREQLNETQYLDIVQAILYAEFQKGGYEAAMRVSDKCILITRTDEAVHNLEQFQANVDYTSLLQEFVQQFGVDFPKYNYVQVSKKIHLPTFRCQASFQGFVAEATGNSKKRARQKAAHDLLKQLTRTVGPSENKPKG